MKIEPGSNSYFHFYLGKDERELPEAREFISRLKAKIPYKGRYWIKEKRLWAVHRDYFPTFMELVKEFYRARLFKQGELI